MSPFCYSAKHFQQRASEEQRQGFFFFFGSDDCLQRQVCFIKFYTSSGLSNRSAIRLLSFSLCKPSISAPTLPIFPFQSICLSLSLSRFAFYLLHFSFRASFTTLFFSRSCVSLRSYSSLLSLRGSPFPSRAGHTPSALVTGCPQLPETSEIIPSKRLLLETGTEREKNKGLM